MSELGDELTVVLGVERILIFHLSDEQLKEGVLIEVVIFFDDFMKFGVLGGVLHKSVDGDRVKHVGHCDLSSKNISPALRFCRRFYMVAAAPFFEAGRC